MIHEKHKIKFSRRRAGRVKDQRERHAAEDVPVQPLGDERQAAPSSGFCWFSGYPAERLSWGVAPYPKTCYACVTESLLTKRHHRY